MQKPIAFALFILLAACIVPLFIRFFLFMARKSGNQTSGMVTALQENSTRAVFLVWGMIAVTLVIALPYMIKTGFFKNETADTATAVSGQTDFNFSTALYPIRQKKLWGYMDNNYRVVIAPSFTEAGDFHEGMATVASRVKDKASGEEEELFGFIDSLGKQAIDFKYEKAADFSEGLAAVASHGKYGFVDLSGREVVPCIYEEVSKFSEGLACVKLNDLNGFIDKTGRMVIKPAYLRACYVSDFHEGLAAVYASPADKAGYINQKGEMVIAPQFNYGGEFSAGLALVQPEGAKFGYIDATGKMAIDPQFELSLPFTEGVASVKKTLANGKTIFQLIDPKGRKLSPDLEYGFVGIFREGLAGFETDRHTWGFIDRQGKVVIPAKYAGTRLFHQGLARMQTGHLFNDLKLVYINRKGEVVWQE